MRDQMEMEAKQNAPGEAWSAVLPAQTRLVCRGTLANAHTDAVTRDGGEEDVAYQSAPGRWTEAGGYGSECQRRLRRLGHGYCVKHTCSMAD